MKKGVNNALKKALLFAALLVSCITVAQQEAPIATRRRFVGIASGATQKIPNPSGALLPSFGYTLVGAPSGVSIVAKGCMIGDTDAQNCVTLETDTSTTTSQIRTFSTNTTAYDYFLITPTFTGGTNPTLTINSTLPPFAKAGSSSGGAPTGAASGSLAGTYPGPSLAAGAVNNAALGAGAVTDDKASLAVKPAVTVVASANTALSGLLTIDGVVTADGSVVLATAQTTGSQNGPWVVHSGAWTRPTWYTSGSTTQAPQFLTTFVRLGTGFQGSTWRMTTAAVTIDTTATTWAQTPLVLSATAIAGLPTATNGVPQIPSSTPTAGVAGPIVFAPTGVPFDAQSSATPAVIATDRASVVQTTNNTTSTAMAVPASGSSGFASNFTFVHCNTGSVVATDTPTTSTVNGNATLKLVGFVATHNPSCAFWWSNNSNYFSALILPTDANGRLAAEGMPAFTGDCTSSAGALALACAKINGTSFAGTNGNLVGFGASNIPVDTGIVASTVTKTIANGTSALGTGAITSGTCATVVTTTATGTATTDNIMADFNGDPTAVTGYAPSASGMLTIVKYPTSGNVNFKVCNLTAGSITPGAITLNWRVVR